MTVSPLGKSLSENLVYKNTFLEVADGAAHPVRHLKRLQTWPSESSDVDVYVQGDKKMASSKSTHVKVECFCTARDSTTEGDSVTSEEASAMTPATYLADISFPSMEIELEAPRSTIMVRSVPRSCSQQNFLTDLDESGFYGTYNFMYLPFSFETKTNMGYAFVNFIDDDTAESFLRIWNETRLYSLPGKTPLPATYADVQGLDANVRRLMGDYKIARISNPSYQPLVFEDGCRVNFRHYAEKLDKNAPTPQYKTRKHHGNVYSTVSEFFPLAG